MSSLDGTPVRTGGSPYASVSVLEFINEIITGHKLPVDMETLKNLGAREWDVISNALEGSFAVLALLVQHKLFRSMR